jgi:hypothetical protein
MNSLTSRPKRSSGLAQSITKLILLASSSLPLLGKPIHQIIHPSLIPKNLTSLFHNAVKSDDPVPRGTPQFWWMMAFIIFLVLLGGCFAGLTLGIFIIIRLILHSISQITNVFPFVFLFV